MNREKVRKALKEVVSEVFGDMYFMFPDVIEENGPPPPFHKACIKASVAFKNGSYQVFLCASERLVEEMARNLLGETDSGVQIDLIDVFREATNVIAGNLVTKLVLGSSVGLDVPVAERSNDCSGTCGPEGGVEVLFDFDGRLLKAAAVV